MQPSHRLRLRRRWRVVAVYALLEKCLLRVSVPDWTRGIIERQPKRIERGGVIGGSGDSQWSGNNCKHPVLSLTTVCSEAERIQCFPSLLKAELFSTGGAASERQTNAWCKYPPRWRSSSPRSPFSTPLAFQTVLVSHPSFMLVCMPSQPCRWQPVQPV